MVQDGLTDLPAGKLAALVTYLERDLAVPVHPEALGAQDHLVRLGAGEIGRYRDIFRAVGQDWLWFSRLAMAEPELAAILANPRVFALALHRDGRDIGLLELDFSEAGTAYLAFFGLVSAAIGDGIGRALMAEGLRRAKAAGFQRIAVNTCTLDHPRALEFYQRSAFVVTRRAIEIFDDPRLTGAVPRGAARHIPLID
jgi:GNAT superfamily N-acetyltransferase